MRNREEARRAAEALLAEARHEQSLRKQALFERACRRLRRWESPLIPALAAGVATWAISQAMDEPLISIALGVTAGYLYALLGRRSAQDAVDRIEGR